VDKEGNPVNETINSQAFWTTASGGRYGSAEFFTYDATNFRVRELSLGYSFPLGSSVLKAARLSLVARNLFFLYRGSSELSIPGLGRRKMSFDPDMSLVMVTGKVSLMVRYHQPEASVLTCSLHFKKIEQYMKKYIFILKKVGSVALLCSIVLAMSCTDDYDEINTNTNKISVLGPAQIPFFFQRHSPRQRIMVGTIR
jgi:hypothetical protein